MINSFIFSLYFIERFWVFGNEVEVLFMSLLRYGKGIFEMFFFVVFFEVIE